MSNDLFEFELEKKFEKYDPYREELHQFIVIAKNHDEAKKIVDKFGGDVSWTNYSVNKMYRRPTTKYTESRLINYVFMVSNDDEDERYHNKSEETDGSNLLQSYEALVKENKKYNLNKDGEGSKEEEQIIERYKDPLADLFEEAVKNLEATKNIEETTKNEAIKNCCIIV
jgi:hypothetical protein